MPLNKFRNAIKINYLCFSLWKEIMLAWSEVKTLVPKRDELLENEKERQERIFHQISEMTFPFFSLNGRYFSELLVFETVLLKVLNFWSENFVVRKVLRGELEQKPFLIIANNNLLRKDIFLNRRKETRDFGWSLHKRLIKSDHGSNGTRRSYGRLLWHPMDLWRYVVASPWQ